MRTVAHNRLKAGPKIVLHLPPELLQLFRRRDLRDGLLAHMVVEPLHKPGQCHAVLNMGHALVLALHRILHGLGAHRGIGMLDQGHRCGDALQNRIVELAGIHQNTAVAGNLANVLIQLQIGPQGYAVCLQRAAKLRAELPLIGVQD